MSMNFSLVLEALNQASAFELYRLRAAIDRKLADPAFSLAVRSSLTIGQEIEYFSPRENVIQRARLEEFHRKQVLVTDIPSGERWLIGYNCINVNGVDVEIREQPKKGLGRNEVKVGETLGFLDREGRERSGIVLRLNDKTVSLQVGNGKWRVAYALLHRVMDAIPGTVVDLPPQATLLLPEAE